MKFLSMKIDGDDRAGVLLGAEVIDITAFYQFYNMKFAPDYRLVEAMALRDALDLHYIGLDWLHHLLWVLEAYSLHAEAQQAGIIKPLTDVQLNPPVLRPGKILAVGLNYAAHAAEQGIEPPASPLIFTKNTTSLTAPNAQIQLPRISDKIDYEGELAFVIGRDAKNVKAERAYDYIAGYTIMNDVTARDLQKSEKQWARAKGLDTFAPCGAVLVTTDEIINPHTLDLKLRVNGELRQDSNTSDLIFKIPQLVEFISQDLTLKAGDIITTGTPSGVGVHRHPPIFLKDGDVIEIAIEGIGVLINKVAGRNDD
jgi:2-keto-4-pentenoate hydratase/2-oxohepta-3-ene-1,7-dioic acid hydratase in catechol pathway